ncbi:MAG: hypothetical protein LRY76_05665 [Alphaproteobacteria bacterium]|nr:hypothetical protein [Alphaproteobacteria bacterium]MCD8570997.1 hypothetical protein [Alphaproteobacteria bacterium]
MDYQKETHITRNRDELIELSRVFAKAVKDQYLQSPDTDIVIQIEGDYASGKSLVADVIRAEFFGQTDIDPAKWRHLALYDGKTAERSTTVAFVNARFDILNILPWCSMIRKQNPGLIFITNKPANDIGNYIPALGFERPTIKIGVYFTENAVRPVQMGPIKVSAPTEMGERRVTFETLER